MDYEKILNNVLEGLAEDLMDRTDYALKQREETEEKAEYWTGKVACYTRTLKKIVFLLKKHHSLERGREFRDRIERLVE